MRDRLNRLALNIVAALLAALFAGAVTSLILWLRGDSPSFVISQMWHYGTQPSSEVTILNSATIYYLSGLAVAIGFRMNLFNIGVDGQYQIAAFFAAVVGGWLLLPGPLLIIVVVLVAVVVGAIWAGIAAVLKVTRGVSEVISTIMLNVIGGGIVAYLLDPHRLGTIVGTQQVTTKPMPA